MLFMRRFINQNELIDPCYPRVGLSSLSMTSSSLRGQEWGEVRRPDETRAAALGIGGGVAWVLDAQARLFFRCVVLLSLERCYIDPYCYYYFILFSISKI